MYGQWIFLIMDNPLTTSIILSKKLSAEYKTIKAMVRIYCRSHHNTHGLCADCISFLDYAFIRLDRCPYGEEKPTCNKCPIHCYKPAEKKQAKTMMGFAGARMLLRHPIMAVDHLWREYIPVPKEVPKANSNRHLRLSDSKKIQTDPTYD